MFLTCLSIFLARIVDVSICTFRTMMMVKRKSIIVPILAFLEAFIWFMVVRKALNTNLDSMLIPICYSLGYATGTFIGGFLSRRFIKVVNSVEVVTTKNNYKLIDALRDKDYGVMVIGLKDNLNQNKDLLIVDVKSRLTKEVIDDIKRVDPEAFIVVKDTELVYNGYIK